MSMECDDPYLLVSVIEKRPTDLGPLLLPFLVTRIYAGAGGAIIRATTSWRAFDRPACGWSTVATQPISGRS